MKSNGKPIQRFELVFARVAGRRDDGETRACGLAQAFLSDLGLQNIIAGRTRKDTATGTPHPKGPFVHVEIQPGAVSTSSGRFKMLKSNDGAKWETVEQGEFNSFGPADRDTYKDCFEVFGVGASYPRMEFILRETTGQPVAPAPAAQVSKEKPPQETAIKVARVRVDEIDRFEGQPRVEFDDPSAMAESLKQEGQLEFITVTPLEGVPGKKWRLVNGERRYLGAVHAGLEYVDVRISDPMDDRDRRWRSYIANFGNKPHTVYESVMYLLQLEADGRTVEQISRAATKDRAWVLKHLALKTLARDLLEEMRESVVEAKRLRFAVARMLAEVPDQAKQRDIWNRALRLGKPRAIEKFVQKEVAALVPNGRAKRAINDGPSHQNRKIKRSLVRSLTDAAMFRDASAEQLYLLLHDGKPRDQVIGEVRNLAETFSDLAKRLETNTGPK